jgi:Raf kinase inhibitor-like YbhB/YbcL family protein
MAMFELSSTAFPPGGAIPTKFTCDGRDISPDLAWSGTPDGTGALVLVVDDPDARGFIHWLVLDLAPSADGSLPPGISTSAEAPAQGTNDFGRIGWGGPCPPSGEHRYVFTLTALAAPLDLPGAPGGAEVGAALRRATVLGTAVLQGTYRRQ